ncbi:MAG: LysR family transcriptional regulator [Pseudomonadota bacterium]
MNTNLSNQNRYRQLRAFCQTAKAGSISKGAARLQLSQPSVSLHIQALERELDILLFERRGPRIRLTPAGELLLELAEPLVEGMDNLVDNFSSAVSEVKAGPLDIAAGESTLLYILPELTKRFMDTFPNISVRLHNVTGRDGMTMMREDTVDFAIGAMDEVPEDLTYYPIYNYDPILIVPLNHPLAEKQQITLEDISQHGFILPPRSLSTLNQIDAIFRDNSLSCQVVLEVGGWEVIKRYVELGLGISIVTSFCLRGHEKLVKIPVGQFFPSRSFGVVMRRGKFLSPQAKAFVEFMDADFFTSHYGEPEARNDKEFAALSKLKQQLQITNLKEPTHEG